MPIPVVRETTDQAHACRLAKQWRYRIVAAVVTLCAFSTNPHALAEDVSLLAMPALAWTERAPGVWSAQIGEPDAIDLASFAAAEPKRGALGAMESASLPFKDGSARGSIVAGRAIAHLPLQADERLYGLGLQFKGLNRRGSVHHLRVDHYGGVLGRTHAPVPFYVSSAGYGVFFNTARFISAYPGIGNRRDSANLPPIRDRNTDPKWAAQPTSDAVEASVVGTGLEVFVFAGPTALDSIRRYNLYFGGGALPPRWGLGFWHRVPTNATADAIRDEVAQFNAQDFPLDVIGLEPGWQSKSYPGTFDWNAKNFPEPASFISEMRAKGIQVNLWENPYLSPESSMYGAMLPYTGSHMVWLGVVPDYTLEASRKILQDHHEETHLSIGVSGYKIDEVDGIDEWLWPDHAAFPSGTSAEVMRQTYGLQLQQTLYAMFHERNQRTYSLVRGSNGAASGYPFVLYSDYYDHRGFVTTLVNSGFSGVLWTPEIRSARTKEEWVRRMQTVCLSHLAQLNAWASGTKPWSMPEVNDAIRAAMHLRMQLIPYLYTAFAEYHFEGTPPIRAVTLEAGFPDSDEAMKQAETEFMIGARVLAAPMFGAETSRQVAFPRGKWFNFFSGELVSEGETIETVNAALDEIPLFVRNGSIIPLATYAPNVTAMEASPQFEMRVYGDDPATGRLYTDDGKTFDYERGDYGWYRMTAIPSDDEISPAIAAEKLFGSAFPTVEWRYMSRSR